MKIERRDSFGWPDTTAARADCDMGLVIHYDGAASPKGVAKWTHEQCLAYWHWCRRFHMQTNGWRDIGYSYGCCPHGIVLEGRGWRREQAAQPGGNTSWTSVTLMLGDDEDPTPAQIEGVRDLRKYLRGQGLGVHVRGHRDFVATSCPGNRLYARLDDFRKDPTPAKAPEKKETAVASAADVWKHEIKAPWVGQGEDDMWQAQTHLRVMHSRIRGLEGKVNALAEDNKVIRAQNTEILARLNELNERLLAMAKERIAKAEAEYDAGAKAGEEFTAGAEKTPG